MPSLAATTIRGTVRDNTPAHNPLVGVLVEVIDMSRSVSRIYTTTGGAILREGADGVVRATLTTGAGGSFYYYDGRTTDDPASPVTLCIRAWSQPTRGEGVGIFYNYYYTPLRSALEGPGSVSPIIDTIYQATSPPKPLISGDVNYDHDFNPIFSLSIADGTPLTEITGDGARPAFTIGSTRTLPPPITALPDSDSTGRAQNFTGGSYTHGTYQFVGKERNYFGPSPDSDPLLLEARTVAAVGQVYNLRIDLLQPRALITDADRFKLSWDAQGVSNFSVYNSTRSDTGYVLMAPQPTVNRISPTHFETNDILIGPPDPQEVYFRVIPSGAGIDISTAPREVAGKMTYALQKRTSAPETGINSVALPFSRNYAVPVVGGTQIEINTASNVERCTPGFEFAGKWDEGAQRESGYLRGGAGGTVSFDLHPGIGYQVSVINSTPWTVVGIK